jgi:hypothetical protein
MQTYDAIITAERIRYLDPIAICEGSHARPSKWADDNEALEKCEKS